MKGITGKKRRNNQSSIANRYLASIEREGEQEQQQHDSSHSNGHAFALPRAPYTPNSSSRRSKSPHSKKSSRTAVTAPTLDQSNSGSWTETSPSLEALSTSQDLTTPGSMRRDRFSKTPIRFSGFASNGCASSPHTRKFSVFPVTSPARGDPCDNSSLTSRRTSESATTASEKFGFDDAQAHAHSHAHGRFKDDFVGSSIYSSSLVQDPEAVGVHLSLEKSIGHGLELLSAWGPCNSSGVGSSSAPTEVITNRAADTAARKLQLNLVRAPSEASTTIATNRAVDMANLARAPSEVSTTIATNRAVDMAMKRVRQMQNADYEDTLNEAKEAMNQRSESKHPTRYAFGAPTSHPRHLEAKSILSVSSNESSRILSPTQNAPLSPFSDQGDFDQTRPLNSSKGRLGDHMLKEASQGGNHLGWDAFVQAQSVSSSVGVETGGRRGICTTGTSKNVWRSKHQTIEVVDEEGEEEEASPGQLSQDSPEQQSGPSELLLPELNDSGYSHSSPHARQKHTGPLERRIFSVQTKPSRPLTSRFQSPDDPCFSPPSIQRYLQDGSTYSPDPIFCSHRSVTDTSGRMSGSDGSGSIWFGVAAASMRSLSLRSDGETSPDVGRGTRPAAEVLAQRIPHRLPTRENQEGLDSERLPSPDFRQSLDVDTFVDVSEKAECDDFGVSEVFFPNPERECTAPGFDPPVPLAGRESAHETLQKAKSRVQTYARVAERRSRRWPLPSHEQEELTDADANVKDQPLGTAPVKSYTGALPVDFKSRSQIEAKGCSQFNTENGVKTSSSFLAAISTFEKSGRTEEKIEKTAYGKNRIGVHLSRTGDVLDALDTDEASFVDVQSIRSAFEPSVTSPDVLDEDDDNASVKDLRELYEESTEGIAVENGISRARAMFEAKKSTTKRFEGANSSLKEVFSKFETKPVRPVLRHLRTNKEVSEKDHKRSDAIEKDQDNVAKKGPGSFVTLSVADRIRAFGGHGNTVKPLPFHRKGVIGAKTTPPLPPQPLSPPDLVRNMDADGIDQMKPSNEREKTKGAINSSFHDNLKLFSGKKQKEEQAKVVASSVFRERENSLAPTRRHSEPRQSPEKPNEISIIRKERKNPTVPTIHRFDTDPRQSSEMPNVISITRKERGIATEPTARYSGPDHRRSPDNPNIIAGKYDITAGNREYSSSNPNSDPVVLRPVPVKHVLSNTVAIRPVAVRPTIANTVTTLGSQGTGSRSADRVLPFWGDTGQEHDRKDKDQVSSSRGIIDTTLPFHHTGNPPRGSPAMSPRLLPQMSPRLLQPIDVHYTEEKQPAPSAKKPPLHNAVSTSKPLGPESDQASVGSGSEFSDGVTLDISIAEVSNLTNPTALISKTDDKSVATVEEEDEDDELDVVEKEEQPSEASSKDADPIEMEAKRSEASSTQTSEAAAPLIAKAMRLRPMSDDLSADSFFAGEAFLSKHWSEKSGWDLGLRGSDRSSVRNKASSGYAPSIEEVEEEEEEEKKEEEAGQDEINDGWDLRWVESSFPVKESSAGDMFDFESAWQPFPPDPFALNALSSKGSDANVSMTSRSTTPTRKNTSRPLTHQDKFHSATLTTVASLPSQSYSSRPLEYTDALRQVTSANFDLLHAEDWAQSVQHQDELHSSTMANSTDFPLQSYASRPFVNGDKHRPGTSANFASFNADDWSQSVPTSRSMPSHSPLATQSRPSSLGTGSVFGRTHPRSQDPTWKRRAGIMTSQARPDYPAVSMPTSDYGRPPVQSLPQASPPPPPEDSPSPQNEGWNTFSRINRSMGRYGAQHAALIARLRSLKEARMRRARASAAYNRKSPSPLYSPNDQLSHHTYPLPDDEHSHSTMSSTKFGGKTFSAALEVD